MNWPIVFLLLANLALLSWSASSIEDLDPPPNAAPSLLSCDEVILDLVPCLSYLRGETKQPSAACCSGAQKISNGAKSQAAKKDVCTCIKKSLASVGPYDKNLIPLIPQKCGIPLTLPPIDAKTDCSKAAIYV
ncbi:hypothetical protein AB3S75_025662 [Citrus x aurantiifolia]